MKSIELAINLGYSPVKVTPLYSPIARLLDLSNYNSINNSLVKIVTKIKLNHAILIKLENFRSIVW